MRNFKKVIAGALALLMLALSVNVSFAAEEYSEKEAIVVAKVNATGIMTGTDKGFEPTKTLTRAEAAAIMVRMKGISEETVKQNAGTTLFTDVPASHWAAGYINVASNYGLIKGVGANMFAPEKEVTVAEFYTMAIRALGAGQLVEAEGTWPTNYVNFAIENELTKEVAQVYTAASTRLTAATIVANTLTANMWTKYAVVNNGEITWTESEGKTILGTILNIDEYKKVAIDDVNLKDRKADFDNGTVTPSIDKDNCKVGENANLASVRKGQTYTVWYDREEKEVVGFWIPDDNDQINFTEVKGIEAKKIKLKVNGEEEKFDLYQTGEPLAVATTYYFNGALDEGATKIKASKLPVSGIAYLEDGDIKTVYGEAYENFGVVKEVKNNKIYFEYEDMKGVGTLFTSATLVLKLEKNDKEVYKVTKDGKEIDVKDLEAGDALYWYKNGDVYTMEVVNDTVDGKIVSATSKKVEIDDKEYDLYEADLAGVKDEGTFYLYNGKITMWHKDKEDKGNFAIISAERVINGTEKDSYDYQVKLLSLDGTLGEWTTVDVKETNKKLETDYADDKTDPDKDDWTFAADQLDAAYNTKDIVTYSMKSGKVVFTKDYIGDVEAFYGYVDASKDYISLDNTHFAISTVAADEKFFITGSTIVAELDEDDDEFTLRILDAEDIDTLFGDATHKLGFAADFDKNEVGIVVFDVDKSEVKTNNTWAYVKDVVECTREDNEDITRKISVVYAGESSVTTLYSKDSIGSIDPDDMIGLVYNLAVTDKVITKATRKDLSSTKDSSPLTAYKYLYKEYGDNMRNFANTDFNTTIEDKLNVVESDYYAIAEDAIVIKLTYKDSAVDKRDISSLASIDALTQEKGDDTNVDLDVDEIKNYWLEKVDDEYVVVAIEYEAKER